MALKNIHLHPKEIWEKISKEMNEMRFRTSPPQRNWWYFSIFQNYWVFFSFEAGDLQENYLVKIRKGKGSN